MKKPCKVAKTQPASNEPGLDEEPPITENKETHFRISKPKEGEPPADHLVRKVRENPNPKNTEQFFETLYMSAGIENSVGITFTVEDIGEAYVRCIGDFDPPLGKGKPKGRGKGRGRNGKKKGFTPGIAEHHGVMIMYYKEVENRD